MKECKNCGTKYNVSIILLPDMDKDRIKCIHCGETLVEWHGAYMYVVRKITGPTKQPSKRGLLAKCKREAFLEDETIFHAQFFRPKNSGNM